ncbi:MAG: response regulator [Candidatus Gracilibacteria bacterium]|nr:response regulator [Candidatus Gracilibacteria bacterium]
MVKRLSSFGGFKKSKRLISPEAQSNLLSDEKLNERIKQELSITKELLLAIAEGTSDMIYAKDNDGKYIFVNSSFSRFVGKTDGEILTGDFSSLKIDDIELEKGECIKYEKILENLTGESRVFSVMKGPINNDKGEKDGTFGIFRDITRRKDLEISLETSQEQLQLRQRMDSLGTLASGIGHDFNNLLGGIMGFLDLLKLSGGLTEKQIKYVETALLSTRRAAELVRQLQFLSKNNVTEKTDFDLFKITREVFNLLEKTTDKVVKKIIDFNVGEFFVNGSESQLHQVFLNLGTNSFKAIEEKGSSDGDYIKINAEDFCLEEGNKFNLPKGDYVHIIFEDTGIGMLEDVAKQAFDPLFTTRKKTGQGLGLAMVYYIIVKKHKGFIDIDTKLGVGTKINIYLPKVSKPSSIINDEMFKLTGGTETILIIDDEQMIQDIAKKTLEMAGYKVLIAHNGKEGLDLYIKNANKVDLVLLDLTMPFMSGQEVFEEMLRLRDDIRVIICSGHNHREKGGVISRAREYVNKPYSFEQLLSTVRKVLEE